MTDSASGAALVGVTATEARLEILYTHVGGIDVHKKQVTVTARTPDPKRAARWETTRTFRTFYGDLLEMATWLVHERAVTHVAMESTGPYWWPVYCALREVGGPGLNRGRAAQGRRAARSGGCAQGLRRTRRVEGCLVQVALRHVERCSVAAHRRRQRGGVRPGRPGRSNPAPESTV